MDLTPYSCHNSDYSFGYYTNIVLLMKFRRCSSIPSSLLYPVSSLSYRQSRTLAHRAHIHTQLDMTNTILAPYPILWCIRQTQTQKQNPNSQKLGVECETLVAVAKLLCLSCLLAVINSCNGSRGLSLCSLFWLSLSINAQPQLQPLSLYRVKNTELFNSLLCF